MKDHSKRHADSQKLLGTLREVLKSKKITYAKLAKSVGVSEVTVKRWFSGQSCSLQNIFSICDVLGISFFDLAALAKTDQEVDYFLSSEQEKYFAGNPAAFGILKALQKGIEPKRLSEVWKLSWPKLFRILRKFEKMGLLEIMPSDQVRVKVVGNIRTQHRGPFARAILRPQILQFLDHVDVVLKNPDVCMHSAEVELSEKHISEFVEEIHALGAKYRARAFRDKSLLAAEKLRSVRWLFGFAPYQTNWQQYPLRDE